MNDLCTSTTEKGSFFYFSGYIQMPYVKASVPCCGFVSPLRHHCPMLANGVSIISTGDPFFLDVAVIIVELRIQMRLGA